MSEWLPVELGLVRLLLELLEELDELLELLLELLKLRVFTTGPPRTPSGFAIKVGILTLGLIHVRFEVVTCIRLVNQTVTWIWPPAREVAAAGVPLNA